MVVVFVEGAHHLNEVRREAQSLKRLEKECVLNAGKSRLEVKENEGSLGMPQGDFSRLEIEIQYVVEHISARDEAALDARDPDC